MLLPSCCGIQGGRGREGWKLIPCMLLAVPARCESALRQLQPRLARCCALRWRPTAGAPAPPRAATTRRTRVLWRAR